MNAAAAPATTAERDAFRREFVEFAMRAGVLRFGEIGRASCRERVYSSV